MKKRVMILSASVGSGHVRAADALEKSFRERDDVAEVFSDDSLDHTNILHKQFYSSLYKRLSKLTPEFLGWWYETSDDPWRTDQVRLMIDLPQSLPLVNLIRDFRPDHIVCTHFMPAGVIAHLLGRKQVQTRLSIVVTDFHFHAMWITPAFHHYFVSQEEDRIHMEALGLPPDRITISGIPIDPSFENPIDSADVHRSLGLRPDLPVLLVSGGTLGLSPSVSVVRNLRRLAQPFQAVVLCGRGESLKQRVAAEVAGDERFRVMGYTDRMRDLMAISTLMLTKPGGLTTAEALACGLPLVILDPIGGQEERNCDMLLENGAAIKCGEVTVVCHKVGQLLSDNRRLDAMANQARSLGHPGASRQIAETVMTEVRDDPRTYSRKERDSLRRSIKVGN
jgi:processive 1,2-diacylglycerol beta-glucosyltransferase